jgi:uncharacterized protein (TIGR02302 family)
MTRLSPIGRPSFFQTKKVQLRLALAWLAMVCELLADRLWPAVTVLAFGVAVALTDVLPSLPPALHLAVLLAFATGLAAMAWRALRDVRWPTRNQARARVEAASAVTHRPLTATEDTLAAGATPLQRMLWRRHQRNAGAALDKLRAPWPMSSIARRDVFALRAIAVLLLIVSAAGASGDIGPRLGRALSPGFDSDGPITLKLWITPPAYTSRAPIFVDVPSLPARNVQPLDVAAGSKALVIVTGAGRGTTLVLQGKKQATRVISLTAFDSADAHDSGARSSRVETTLTARADHMEVRRGAQVLASWPVHWIPDEPPTIAIAAAPKDAGSGRLRVDYTVGDDYGVQKINARVVPLAADGKPAAAPIEVALTAPLLTKPDEVLSSLIDLASLPWAGQHATLQLSATDQADQTTASQTVDTVIPERTFTHPVAQEIVRWRHELMADGERAEGPAREAFAALLEKPAAFKDDDVVYLALSAALYRLTYETPQDAMKGLPELLWRTAVRIEEGDRGAAESRLAAAERDLQNALAQNASADEISRLVDQLQQALAEYTRSLLDHMPNGDTDLGAIDPDGNITTPDDIAALMEQFRQLTQMGAHDAARQVMAQIQQMLQSLRNAAAAGSDNPDMRAAEQMMRDLHDLTEAQSQLLNDSFAHVRQNAAKPPRDTAAEKNAAAGAAAQQMKLRQRLDALQKQVEQLSGHPAEDLSGAAEAMDQAQDQLQAGAWQPGAETQGVALSKLQSGMQQATKQVLRALADKGTSGFMRMQGGPRRYGANGPRGGPGDNEDVHVPTGPDAEGMAQRARAILEEIRRRASDRERPAQEQDYLRRLMKSF